MGGDRPRTMPLAGHVRTMRCGRAHRDRARVVGRLRLPARAVLNTMLRSRSHAAPAPAVRRGRLARAAYAADRRPRYGRPAPAGRARRCRAAEEGHDTHHRRGTADAQARRRPAAARARLDIGCAYARTARTVDLAEIRARRGRRAHGRPNQDDPSPRSSLATAAARSRDRGRGRRRPTARVVDNLLANVRAHTPPGHGRVRSAAERDGAVLGRGQRRGPADRPIAARARLRPLLRADRARSGDGSGLGLAIGHRGGLVPRRAGSR